MLQINEIENGLLLSVPTDQDREELKDLMKDRQESTIWADLFEPFSCNGSFTPVSPETHYFGLTESPYIIAEEVTYEDNGDLTVYGKLYHYPEYMVKSIPELLAAGETVTLVQWHDAKEGETRCSIL